MPAIERKAEGLPDATPETRLFRLMPVRDLLANVQPPDWLIPGFLERNTLAQIVGKPSACKTTLALDWCCRIATGTAWRGQRIEQQPAVYICGEGRNGIARRLQAWQIFHGIALADAPLVVSNQAARLADVSQASEVFSAIQRDLKALPGLIVVDTLARNFGANENSAEDMSRFIDHLDIYLRQPFEACVAVVHHTGHGNQDRGRGSSSLPGGIDHGYLMEQDKHGLVTLRNNKQKDAELQPDILMRIKAVELPGRDHYGNPYTAPVLEPTDAPAPLQIPQGRNQQNALKLLQALSDEYGADAEPGELIWVPLERWRSDCADVGIDRKRWPETMAGLQERDLVVVNDYHARLNL